MTGAKRQHATLGLRMDADKKVAVSPSRPLICCAVLSLERANVALEHLQILQSFRQSLNLYLVCS